MESLSQIQDIFAGLYNLYIIKTKDIQSFGDIIAGELQGITLYQDKDYTKIPFTQNTADVELKSKSNKIAFNNNAVEMFMPGNDSDQVLELSEMDGHSFIMIIEDRLSNLWCIGTKEMPLHCSDKYNSGASPTDGSGRKIKFENESIISLSSFASLSNITEYAPSDAWFKTAKGSIKFELKGTNGKTVIFTNDSGNDFQHTLKGTTSIYITVPVDGLVYCRYGAEYITTLIFSEEDSYITEVGNMDQFSALTTIDFSGSQLQTIDLTGCSTLATLNLMSCSLLTDILVDVGNTIQTLSLTSCVNLVNLDIDKFKNAYALNLSGINGLTFDMDFSDFDNLLVLGLNTVGLNQAEVDLVYTSILANVQANYRTGGQIRTDNNVAPSATGLAAIATLETTYYFTITHD